MSKSGLPLWLLLIAVIVVAIAMTMSLVALGNRILPSELPPTHNPSIAPLITAVGIIYGALLGFTVVTNWEQFSSTRVMIASEASALTTMYRQSVAMPDPEQIQVHELLRRYATAVAGPEWNQQGSNVARAAITSMYRVVGAQAVDAPSKPIQSEFISQLSVLASDRNERITGTKPRMPALLWVILISGAVVLIGLMSFLRLTSALGHVIVTCSIAILLGLLLSVVFAFDYSFATDRQFVAGPFNHALEIFDLVEGL
jgi:hypothetical protein